MIEFIRENQVTILAITVSIFSMLHLWCIFDEAEREKRDEAAFEAMKELASIRGKNEN